MATQNSFPLTSPEARLSGRNKFGSRRESEIVAFRSAKERFYFTLPPGGSRVIERGGSSGKRVFRSMTMVNQNSFTLTSPEARLSGRNKFGSRRESEIVAFRSAKERFYFTLPPGGSRVIERGGSSGKRVFRSMTMVNQNSFTLTSPEARLSGRNKFGSRRESEVFFRIAKEQRKTH